MIPVVIEIEDSRTHARRSVELGALDEPIWIGRDPSCAVVLEAPEISRRHLRLARAGDALEICDRSANGTRVGDTLLRHAGRTLDGPTRLHLGPFRLALALPRAGARGEPPPVPLEQAEAEPKPLGAACPAPSPGASGRGSARAQDERAFAELRRRLHAQLLDALELPRADQLTLEDGALRRRVLDALRRIIANHGAELPPGVEAESLARELADEALGLGPLEALLADARVTEIMVVDPRTIYAEREGKLERTQARFTDDEAVRAAIERIVTPLGRRIDESAPLCDARLPDGSRVNAVIPPLAVKGPCLTIRKFTQTALGMADLVRLGSLDARMARFLERAVRVRKNILVAGGTGSGKTTLLNVLSGAVPAAERIVTIEDAAELRLAQPHVVALEARPPNLEGKGEHTIRDLLKNALRMRPDRIIVGECRGGEALDMLQAMNTGHEGSMTTTHANSPREALLRLETLCLMSGVDLPVRAVRAQIASSLHLLVQQSRLGDGSRKVTGIAEVVGLGDEGEIELCELFSFVRLGTGGAGEVLGEFRPSGYLPSFLDELVAWGVAPEGDFL